MTVCTHDYMGIATVMPA